MKFQAAVSQMRILARIVVNLRAAGPAAVLVAWIICVTLSVIQREAW